MIALSSCYGDLVPTDFLHCAVLHHPSFDKIIFTLVPLIFKDVHVASSRNSTVCIYNIPPKPFICARALNQSHVEVAQC